MQLLSRKARISLLFPAVLVALSNFAIAAPSGSTSTQGSSDGVTPYPNGGADFQKPTEYRQAKKLIKDKKYAEALTLLLKANQKSPNDPDILNELGFVYRQTGDLGLGLKFYEQALKLNPDHKEAREYLGELYLMQGQLALAQLQLKELERICPQGCEARTELEKAIAAYQASHPAPSQ